MSARDEHYRELTDLKQMIEKLQKDMSFCVATTEQAKARVAQVMGIESKNPSAQEAIQAAASLAATAALAMDLSHQIYAAIHHYEGW